ADLCRRALAEGRPVAETDVVLPGDRHLTLTCFPARLDDGTVVGAALMAIDLTERRRLAQLEMEAERLRATAELAFKLEEAQRLAGFGSWEYEPETGRFHWSTQLREILGVENPTVVLPEGGIVHPDDADRADQARRGLLEDGNPYAMDLRLVRPDGRVVDVISTGEVIRDEQGQPLRCCGTCQAST